MPVAIGTGKAEAGACMYRVFPTLIRCHCYKFWCELVVTRQTL